MKGTNCDELLVGGRGEQDEVAVGVFDNEGLGLPWFGAQGLVDGDVCGFVFGEQLMDFAGAGERDGSGEQVFAFADVAGKDRHIHVAEREVGVVAAYLGVEGRVAVGEVEGEAELRSEEAGGGFEVADVEMGGDRGEGGLGHRRRSIPQGLRALFNLRLERPKVS